MNDRDRIGLSWGWAGAALVSVLVVALAPWMLERRGVFNPAATPLACTIPALAVFATGLFVWRITRRPGQPRRRESPDLYTYDAEDEVVGGDFVVMEATATHRRESRRPSYPLPAQLQHNGVLLLPRFAKAILDDPRHSTSRDDVFFQMDCNGEQVPDTDATRRFHARFKDMLRAAHLCVPVGGGGVRPNREGLRVLQVTANEGRAGLTRELNRLADAELHRLPRETETGQGDADSGVPTETPNVRGGRE